MKFSVLLLPALFSAAAAQETLGTEIPGDLTTSEVFSHLVVVSQGGAVYTKTRVETYTGQATTLPTSGVATTVFTVENSLATYTKTLVVTYSEQKSSELESVSTDNNTSNDVTATTTISLEYNTYTKTLTHESTDASFESSADGAMKIGLGLGGVLAAAAVILL